ncbi:MAG: hypothetical protein O2999_04450 [Nitrospirae bacterium]|nr:hypothetical protein [Nitrospirota bacterium]MDA1303539.1 hypothetical protein [Nitrospirota bacterium]
MSQELEVLQMVTGRLAEANLPYMVTGSIAMNYYAVPRMTRDIDIVVELVESDIDLAVQIFQQDFYIDQEMVQGAVKNRSMFNVIHNDYLIKVDLIVRKDNEYRRTEFSRKQGIEIGGHELNIVAPEDLILSKLEWAKDSHSEMQLRDVRNLLSCVQDLDREYLSRWSTDLGLNDLYKETLQ